MLRRILLFVVMCWAWSGGALLAGDGVSAEIDRRLAEEVFAKHAGPMLAPRTSDEIFLRRVYLDLVGQPPTPDEVREFVRDTSEGKRSAKIAALVADPRFGVNAANYWRDVLLARAQTTGEGPSMDLAATEAWFALQFNANAPWDQMVRSMIQAEGPVRDKGEGALFLAQRFSDVAIAGEVSRIFLGIQIQCAECHDHPTDGWKRQQFHELAAFFPRVGIMRFERTPGRGEQKLASYDSGPQERTQRTRFVGVPQHYMPDLRDPASPGTLIEPAFFLNGQRLKSEATDAERRQAVSQWLTARENPWFSKAFVNRLWAELVGEGFQEPVDDLGAGRECASPLTFEYLATQFADRRYDIKWLYQTVLETAAYQRESRPRRQPSGAPFAANVPQPLRADQFAAVLSQAIGQDVVGSRQGQGGQYPYLVMSPLQKLFSYDPSVRRDEIAGTIPQVLLLMNSDVVNRAVNATDDRSVLGKLLKAAGSDHEAVTALYLQVLSREPSQPETKVCLDYLKAAENHGQGCEDLYWTLLNSEELRYRN